MRGFNKIEPTLPKACPACRNRLVDTEAGFFCLFCNKEFFECDHCSQIYPPEGISDFNLHCWSCRLRALATKGHKLSHRLPLTKLRQEIRLTRQKALAFPPLHLENVQAESCLFCSSSVPQVRAHRLVYELPIKTKPKDLMKRLEKGNWISGLKHQNMKNWSKYYGEYGFQGFDAYIEVTHRRVFVRLRDIWAETVIDAVSQSTERIIQIKKELEETFSHPGKQAFRLGHWKQRTGIIAGEGKLC